MNKEKTILAYFQLNEKERQDAFMAQSTLEILRTKRFAAGRSHIVFLNDDGTVSAYGNNNAGQCDTGNWSRVVKIAAGDFHTVGLTENGTVLAVGDNSFGQCEVTEWQNVKDLYADKGLTVGVDAWGNLLFTKGQRVSAAQSGLPLSAVPAPVDFGNDQMTQYNRNMRETAGDGSKKTPYLQDENFEYNKMKDGSLVITRYIGSGANVVIPPNVMSIGYRVFYGNQTIETIFLPDSIRLIGSEAFAACPRLKELRLPPFVVQIGNDIVYDNTTLFCPFNSGTAGLLIKKGIPFQGC